MTLRADFIAEFAQLVEGVINFQTDYASGASTRWELEWERRQRGGAVWLGDTGWVCRAGDV